MTSYAYARSTPRARRWRDADELRLEHTADTDGGDQPEHEAHEQRRGSLTEHERDDVAPTGASITGAAFITIAAGRSWCGFQMVSPLADKIGDAVLRGRSFGCGYFEIYSVDLKQQGSILAIL